MQMLGAMFARRLAAPSVGTVAMNGVAFNTAIPAGAVLTPAPGGRSLAPPSKSNSTLSMNVFLWRTAFDCNGQKDVNNDGCQTSVSNHVADLARQTQANVAAVLVDASQKGQKISSWALKHWGQVSGFCSGSTAELLFSPEWKIVRSYSGCTRAGSFGRPYAVAAVKTAGVEKAWRVKKCKHICVIALQANSSEISVSVKKRVQHICKNAAKQCVVAAGEWEMPRDEVAAFWSKAIGTEPMDLIEPPINPACCAFNQNQSDGQQRFNVVASNVPQVYSASSIVGPTERTTEYSAGDSNVGPVMVHLRLPSSRVIVGKGVSRSSKR